MSWGIGSVRSSFALPDVIDFDSGGGTSTLVAAADADYQYYIRYGTRSLHGNTPISRKATAKVAQARADLALFADAEVEGVCFVKSATEGLEDFAEYLAKSRIVGENDHIVATVLDHESNITSWINIAPDRVHLAGISSDGRLDMDDLERLLREHHPKIVAFPLAANIIGTMPNQQQIAEMARHYNNEAIVVGDAVHAAPHAPVSMKGLDAMILNMYKVWAPYAAILAIKPELLRKLDTGKMPQIPDEPPYMRFEKGASNWASYVGAAAAVRWIAQQGNPKSSELEREDIVNGMESLREYEHGLFLNLLRQLRETPGVTIYGIKDDGKDRAPTVPFTIQGRDSSDVVAFLQSKGMEIRSSHYYAVRLAEKFGRADPAFSYQPVNGGLVRASMAPFLRQGDIDVLAQAVREYSPAAK